MYCEGVLFASLNHFEMSTWILNKTLKLADLKTDTLGRQYPLMSRSVP